MHAWSAQMDRFLKPLRGLFHWPWSQRNLACFRNHTIATFPEISTSRALDCIDLGSDGNHSCYRILTCYRIINIDSLEEKIALLLHLNQPQNTSCRFFDTPTIALRDSGWGSSAWIFLSRSLITFSDCQLLLLPSRRHFPTQEILWISKVASPPSSTIWSGPYFTAKLTRCMCNPIIFESFTFKQIRNPGCCDCCLSCVTWVEKMLQEHHRTSAPRSRSLDEYSSWMVMWSDPMIFTPAKGFDGPYFTGCHESGHFVFGNEISSSNSARGYRQLYNLRLE